MIRNRYELSLMRKSGSVSAQALRRVLQNVRVGRTELELEAVTEKVITSLGGQPAFKAVPGYKWATCITVNEQVVHSSPTDRKIQTGDLVSIDLGTIYKGWYTDCAWTVLVRGEGTVARDDKEKEKFLKTGEEALWRGVAQAIEGNMVGDISYAIQSEVEGARYHVVRSLVGHGIGRSLHEEPEIPGYGQKRTGLLLKEGMTLAIEVIYARGTSDIVLQEDGWTFSTVDGSWAGLFEMTVVVGKDTPFIMTDWRKI